MTTNSGYTTGDTPIGSSIGADTGGSTGRTGTTDRAKETASTAVDQGRNVAGTAKEEAANVAGTAAEEARGVVNEAVRQVSDQAGEQAATQRDRLSATLRTFGDDLEKMVAGEGAGSGMAADLVREISERARTWGSHLQDREPGQLVEEARDFARRRPGTFLVGALAAGVVAGRLFRATADGAAAASLADTTPAPTPPAATTTGMTGTAPTGYTAPVPSFDADTGIGYGTGPDGTGGLDDVPDPNPTVASRPSPTRRRVPWGSERRTPREWRHGNGPTPSPTPAAGGDNRSLGDIVGDIGTDLTTLVKKELELARTELKEEAAKAGKGAGLLGGAGVAGLLTLMLACLRPVVPARQLDAGRAGVPDHHRCCGPSSLPSSAKSGRSAIKQSNPQLPETQRTLKEDAAWVKAQKN